MIKIEKSSAPRVVIGKHLTSLIEKNNKINSNRQRFGNFNFFCGC